MKTILSIFTDQYGLLNANAYALAFAVICLVVVVMTVPDITKRFKS